MINKKSFAIFYKNFRVSLLVLTILFCYFTLNFALQDPSKIPLFAYLISMTVNFLVYFLLIFVSIAMFIIDDKTKQLKTIFRIMGLKNEEYLVGNFLFGAYLTVLSLAQVKVGQLIGRLFRKGDSPLFVEGELVINLVGFLGSLQIILWAIAVSHLFKTPKTFSFIGSLFYLGLVGLNFAAKMNPVTDWLFYLVVPSNEMVSILNHLIDVIAGKTPLDVVLAPHVFPLLFKLCLSVFFAVYIENVASDESNFGQSPLFFMRWFKGRPVPHPSPELVPLQAPLIQDNTVRVTNLSKQFGTFHALKNINLDLEPGKIHFVLGHNGAGKSTLINQIVGLQQPTSGEVTYNNRRIVDIQNQDSSYLKISICPSHDLVFDYLPVRDHLRVACWVKGIDDVDQAIAEVSSRFGLESYLDFVGSKLSGGYKRKLTLAMCMIGDYHLLFLDEPTASLDSKARREVWDVLRSLRAESADRIILMTTHHLEEAEALSDKIVFLSEGEIKVVGTVDQLKKDFGSASSVDIIWPAEPSPSAVASFKDRLTQGLAGAVEVEEDSWEVAGNKVSLQVSKSNMAKVEALLDCLRKTVPPDCFVSFETNTLEKAYLEIDKRFHQHRSFADDGLLLSALQSLHPKTVSRAFLKSALLIAKNKVHFFISDFTLVATAVIYTVYGVVLHCIMVKYIKPKDGLKPELVIVFVLLPWLLIQFLTSPLGALNLVSDFEMGVKQMLQSFKVPPLAYYLGKLLGDSVLIAVQYGVLFVLFYANMSYMTPELDWKPTFYLCAAVSLVHHFAITLFWYLHHRVFSKREWFQSFSTGYHYLLIALTMGLAGLASVFGCLNETAIVITGLVDYFRPDHNPFSLYSFLPLMAIPTSVYIVLSVVFDNYKMVVNFINKAVHQVVVLQEEDVVQIQDGRNQHLADIKKRLYQTVVDQATETAESKDKVLKTLGLKKRYCWARNVALNGVTMSVGKRCNFGLVGPNGAGKSTFFNILLGRVAKSEGNVEMASTPNFSLLSSLWAQRTPYDYNNFSICFQDNCFWDNFSVRAHLDFYSQFKQVDPQALHDLLVFLEFDSFLDKLPTELSTGNKRKLCIIISLLNNPNVILFDEATTGVDINMRLKLKDIIRFYNDRNDACSVVTTHFLKDIEVFCDQIGIVDHGVLLANVSVYRLKQIMGGFRAVFTCTRCNNAVDLLNTMDAECKVVCETVDESSGQVRVCFYNVSSVFDVLSALFRWQREDSISEFTFNPISVEEIYLELFEESS